MARASVVFIAFFTLFQLAIDANSGQAPIEVLSWRCVEEGSVIAVKGEIRNQSKEPLSLAVVAIFRWCVSIAVRPIMGDGAVLGLFV